MGASESTARTSGDSKPSRNSTRTGAGGFAQSNQDCKIHTSLSKHGTTNNDAGSDASTHLPEDATQWAVQSLGIACQEDDDFEALAVDAISHCVDDPSQYGAINSSYQCAELALKQLPSITGELKDQMDCLDFKASDKLLLIQDQETVTLSLVRYCEDIVSIAAPVRVFCTNTKLGMQAFQDLQAEAKKAKPDKSILQRFASKAHKYLAQAKLDGAAQEQLDGLKAKTEVLITQVREAERRLQKLQQELEAEIGRQEHLEQEARKAQEAKNIALQGGKRAGWTMLIGTIALGVVGGIALGAACAATGGAALVPFGVFVAAHAVGFVGVTASIAAVAGIVKSRRVHVEAGAAQKAAEEQLCLLGGSKEQLALFKEKLQLITEVMDRYKNLIKNIEVTKAQSTIVTDWANFLGDGTYEVTDAVEDVLQEIVTTVQRIDPKKIEDLLAKAENLVKANEDLCALATKTLQEWMDKGSCKNARAHS